MNTPETNPRMEPAIEMMLTAKKIPSAEESKMTYSHRFALVLTKRNALAVSARPVIKPTSTKGIASDKDTLPWGRVAIKIDKYM